MSGWIDREKAIEDLQNGDPSQLYDLEDIKYWLNCLPSVQPETQKLLDDGTLVVYTDIDIIKITRVNINQSNTHYGDLFYRDED